MSKKNQIKGNQYIIFPTGLTAKTFKDIYLNSFQEQLHINCASVCTKAETYFLSEGQWTRSLPRKVIVQVTPLFNGCVLGRGEAVNRRLLRHTSGMPNYDDLPGIRKFNLSALFMNFVLVFIVV